MSVGSSSEVETPEHRSASIKDPEGCAPPSQGGLTYREGQLIMEILAETDKIHSLDIMEINPILDIQNRTAQMAVNLVASLFGKKIL